jgi:hypothetical protein
MQPCNRIYYSKVYWRLSVFRAAHRSPSGALNRVCSLWFIYICGDQPLSRLSAKFPTQPWQWPITTCVYKPEAANTVQSPWRGAVCRSKHAEPSINFGIINSITRLHFVRYFYWLVHSVHYAAVDMLTKPAEVVILGLKITQLWTCCIFCIHSQKALCTNIESGHVSH